MRTKGLACTQTRWLQESRCLGCIKQSARSFGWEGETKSRSVVMTSDLTDCVYLEDDGSHDEFLKEERNLQICVFQSSCELQQGEPSMVGEWQSAFSHSRRLPDPYFWTQVKTHVFQNSHHQFGPFYPFSLVSFPPCSLKIATWLPGFPSIPVHPMILGDFNNLVIKRPSYQPKLKML